MKKRTNMAKTVAKIAQSMANKACGAASMWGTYQPKEPKKMEK